MIKKTKWWYGVPWKDKYAQHRQQHQSHCILVNSLSVSFVGCLSCMPWNLTQVHMSHLKDRNFISVIQIVMTTLNFCNIIKSILVDLSITLHNLYVYIVDKMTKKISKNTLKKNILFDQRSINWQWIGLIRG